MQLKLRVFVIEWWDWGEHVGFVGEYSERATSPLVPLRPDSWRPHKGEMVKKIISQVWIDNQFIKLRKTPIFITVCYHLRCFRSFSRIPAPVLLRPAHRAFAL